MPRCPCSARWLSWTTAAAPRAEAGLACTRCGGRLLQTERRHMPGHANELLPPRAPARHASAAHASTCPALTLACLPQAHPQHGHSRPAARHVRTRRSRCGVPALRRFCGVHPGRSRHGGGRPQSARRIDNERDLSCGAPHDAPSMVGQRGCISAQCPEPVWCSCPKSVVLFLMAVLLALQASQSYPCNVSILGC